MTLGTAEAMRPRTTARLVICMVTDAGCFDLDEGQHGEEVWQKRDSHGWLDGAERGSRLAGSEAEDGCLLDVLLGMLILIACEKEKKKKLRGARKILMVESRERATQHSPPRACHGEQALSSRGQSRDQRGSERLLSAVENVLHLQLSGGMCQPDDAAQ